METCALLRDLGLRDTEPFAEVTGGDLLELSPEELVGDFGVSRFQACSCCVILVSPLAR